MQRLMRFCNCYQRLKVSDVALRENNLLYLYKRSLCKSVGVDNDSARHQQSLSSEVEDISNLTKQSEDNRTLQNVKETEVSTALDQTDAPTKISFLSAYEKYTSDDFLNPKAPEEREESFATMFRNSKFVHLGDPKRKVVIGNIYHTVGDDLYVDFGWKFPCVVQRPPNSTLYVRSAKVRLRINALELSTRFLGSTTEMSLNEADCTLLSIVSSPLGSVKHSEWNESESI